MNAKLLVVMVASALFSVSSYAHECSGGASGGMDATGNQCNDAAAYATADSMSSHESLVASAKAAPATAISGGYVSTSHAKNDAKKGTSHRMSPNRRVKHN